jgi:hypothetical protein
MKSLSLVCPFDKDLFSALSNRTLVVDIEDPADIAYARDRVCAVDNQLEIVRVRWNRPLSELEPRDEWHDIPFILYAPAFGEFRSFFSNRHALRKLKARFFLCSDDPQSILGLKWLASLQFNCGLYFGDAAPDWDALSDLMHYAYYSRAPHSAVEPFGYLAMNYSNTDRITIDSVYYDNPAQHLHVDRDQNIALTSRKLRNRDFIGHGIESIDRIVESEAYLSHANEWQKHMLARDACSFCPSMHVCGGRFEQWLDQDDGCCRFFLDLVDGIEYVRKLRAEQQV